MASPSGQEQGGTGERRPYDSPTRRRQAAETRRRILDAASGLVHELPSWDWSSLTFRAVAQRAGVGERTVYRHFPSQRHLNDAVMERLEEEAGVEYGSVTLDTVAAVADRVFASLPSFTGAKVTSEPDDPTFADAGARRQAALRRAVADAAPGWDEAQRETVAALLDVLWNLPSYERLVDGWGFEPARASAALGWLMAQVAGAVDTDDPPPTA